jgi:hypothetical protein
VGRTRRMCVHGRAAKYILILVGFILNLMRVTNIGNMRRGCI